MDLSDIEKRILSDIYQNQTSMNLWEYFIRSYGLERYGSDTKEDIGVRVKREDKFYIWSEREALLKRDITTFETFLEKFEILGYILQKSTTLFDSNKKISFFYKDDYHEIE